jgi:hypothetical protein
MAKVMSVLLYALGYGAQRLWGWALLGIIMSQLI